jgi:TonB family protein
MRLLAALALSQLVIARPLAAQLVQGQVVAQDGKRPVLGVRVALVDDSARVVWEVRSDSSAGYFFIDAPRPGRFHLAVYDRLGTSFATPFFTVDSGATVERQLVLPDLPLLYAGVPLASRSLEVRRMPSPASPRFPDAQRDAGQTGSVRVAFIVDAEGVIEPSSVNVISSTHHDFEESVRRFLERLEFFPAAHPERPPRVIVQLLFAFNLSDRPALVCDVCTTAAATTHAHR